MIELSARMRLGCKGAASASVDWAGWHPDTVEISYLPRIEALMGRPPGSTNKTPRELRAEAQRLIEKAKYLEKIAALRKGKK